MRMKDLVRSVPRVGRLFIRGFIGLVFIAVILFILLGTINHFLPIGKPPTITEAPWLIRTASRIYYASEYSLQSGVPSIRGYWTLDGKRYHYHSGTKIFPPSSYGTIIVGRRKG